MISWSCGSGWIGGSAGKEGGRMCKGNCASCVKVKSPHGWPEHRGKGEGVVVNIRINVQYSWRFLHSRFCLTFIVRPNYYYTPDGRPHGQTPPARPEDPRAQTDGHAQSSSGNGDRSPVQAEPFFRSSRSSANTLRDAATSQRR